MQESEKFLEHAVLHTMHDPNVQKATQNLLSNVAKGGLSVAGATGATLLGTGTTTVAAAASTAVSSTIAAGTALCTAFVPFLPIIAVGAGICGLGYLISRIK